MEYPFIAIVTIWHGVVAPGRVLSMGQIEQTMPKQMDDIKLLLL